MTSSALTGHSVRGQVMRCVVIIFVSVICTTSLLSTVAGAGRGWSFPSRDEEGRWEDDGREMFPGEGWEANTPPIRTTSNVLQNLVHEKGIQKAEGRRQELETRTVEKELGRAYNSKPRPPPAHQPPPSIHRAQRHGNKVNRWLADDHHVTGRRGGASSGLDEPEVVLNSSVLALYNRRLPTGIHFPITFRTSAAYVVARFRLYALFSIMFQIRTTQSEGLIIYAGNVGSGKDLMVIEIVNGHVRYVFDLGSGPQVMRDTHRYPINDNRWHEVGVLRPSLNDHVLIVDQSYLTEHTPDSRSVYFDTGDELYVGGIPAHAHQTLPNQVRSRDGFRGCLGSLELDREVVHLLDPNPSNFIPEVHRKNVENGCQQNEGVHRECTDDRSCSNGGHCDYQSSGNTCSCEMTSYTGPDCTDESVSYRFGRGRQGLLTFTFPDKEWPDTKRDQIALGLVTSQRDAVIFRIVSGSSNDFIEMELVDGSVLVVYNMGMIDHPVGALFQRVNDGRYHVIRFTRDGPNSTIQVDDQPVQPKHPTGQQLNTFNHQSRIYIGGRRNSGGQSERTFQGTITGFSLNGLRVLDLASEGDDRISVEGDVELEVKPLRGEDDLILSSFVTSSTVTSSDALGRSVNEDTLKPINVDDTLISPAVGPGGRGNPDCNYSSVGENCPPAPHHVTFTTRRGPITDDLIQPVSRQQQHQQHRLTSSPSSSSTSSSFASTARPRKSTTSRHRTKRPQSPSSRPPRRQTAPSSSSSFSGSADGRPVLCGDDNDDEDCFDEPALSSGEDTAEQGEKDVVKEEIDRLGRAYDDIERQQTSFPDSVIRYDVSTSVMTSSTSRRGHVDEDDRGLGGRGRGMDHTRVGAGDSISDNWGDSAGSSAPRPADPAGTGAAMANSFSMNVGLIVGIAAGCIVLLLILIYALLKYRSRDHRYMLAHKIDGGGGGGGGGGTVVPGRQPLRRGEHEGGAAGQAMLPGGMTTAGGATGCVSANLTSCGVGSGGAGGGVETNGVGSCKRKKRDVKEWYV